MVENEKRFFVHFPSLTVFITGSFSALLCSIILQPLDVLKTRLQNPPVPLRREKRTHRLLYMICHIYHTDGLKAFWYGSSATVLRGLPAGGIYFCTYDYLMRKLKSIRKERTVFHHVCVAMASRAVTDTAVIPLTVIKTRLESGVYKYANVLDGLAYVYEKGGVKGLTYGLVPTLARDLPMSAAYIFFYRMSLLVVPRHLRKEKGNIVTPLCAANAAVLSSVITHPPDVLKTQMQLYPQKNPTILAVTSNVYKDHGFKGYYQGFLPRLIKRTIFAIIAWTLYEHVKS